jgi:steroid 5-alpha reductase family enzyme
MVGRRRFSSLLVVAVAHQIMALVVAVAVSALVLGLLIRVWSSRLGRIP